MLSLKKIESIKNDILGKQYSLSVTYVTPKKSREINRRYRKVNKPTNILSFPLRENEGEIILCKAVIKKEAKEKKFGRNFRELLTYLVIHGMLHLKGMRHGKMMERAEKRYLSRNGSA